MRAHSASYPSPLAHQIERRPCFSFLHLLRDRHHLNSVEPQLRRWNQFLKLSATPEANPVERTNENWVLRAREPSVVSSSSITCTFRWALENATSWVVGVVAKVMKESEVDSFIGASKKLLERYALTFPLVKGEVQYKLASLKSAKDVEETGDVGLTLVCFGEFRALSSRELSTSDRKEHRRLCEYVLTKMDEQRSSTMGEFQSYLREQRCAQDHVWVANALFTESGRLKSQLQIWWHPPQPALVYSQSPATPKVFFHHRFFLWMPYRMLVFPFMCSQPGFDRRQLSSC
ncbi:hypothetical protein RRG08_066678 [Elysia crispata]|uniref:DUF6729 domain-containing protein n=1 Tax=Elysia crispata TaxID=231223 RepID=A0AAE1DPV6_9GAST|nr:hypothetical protein RRG08_066678 [Elysia crispata]